jgi:hypothetical protein
MEQSHSKNRQIDSLEDVDIESITYEDIEI